MKKCFSKMLAILCAVCLTISVVVPSFAAEVIDDTGSTLNTESTSVIGPTIYPVAFGEDQAAALDTFNAMTTSELNAYISNLANGVQPASISSVSSLSNNYLAWLAAAVIFHKLGLDCAYTMILYSLENEDYTETNGFFSNKIKQSSTFSTWYAGNQLNSDIEFNSPDTDLALSIHGADIYCINPAIGRYSLIDTYDFDKEDEIQDAVLDLINDGAWLLTECGVLHVVSIAITFDYVP
jgi:hypothetical protein